PLMSFPRLAEPQVTALPQPYLLFLGDITEPDFAKTAFGLRDWETDQCIGELSLPGGTVSTGLPRMTAAEAREAGAQALVIGVANVGGVIPEHWQAALIGALEAGLDVVAGMHTHLSDIPALKAAAARLGRRLIDVRVPPPGIPTATGRKRSGK